MRQASDNSLSFFGTREGLVIEWLIWRANRIFAGFPGTYARASLMYPQQGTAAFRPLEASRQ